MMRKMNNKKIKTTKQMERHLKGISNHYRIGAMLYLENHDKATLEDIIEAMNGNEKTVGEHVRRLTLAGLVNKKYRDKFVEHTLSPYGKMFVEFLRAFQNVK